MSVDIEKIRKLDDYTLQHKLKLYQSVVSKLIEEINKRSGKTKPKSTKEKKTYLKSTVKIMKDVLKSHSINFKSSDKKADIEKLIRDNNLVRVANKVYQIEK